MKSHDSVTQCRKVLGHKASNALLTEPLVVPNCSEENVQRCISWFTPCCEELVSSATTKEEEDEYGLGCLAHSQKKSGKSGAENTLFRAEFITTLRLENRPTQMKNTELLIPMAAKLHTTSNPHNCTTATEVEGGN